MKQTKPCLAALLCITVALPAAAGTIAELTSYSGELLVSLPSNASVSYAYGNQFSQFSGSTIAELGTTMEPVISETPDSSDPEFFALVMGIGQGQVIANARALNSADEAEMTHIAGSGFLSVTNNNTTAQVIQIDLNPQLEVFWYDDRRPLTKISPPGENFGQALAEIQVYLGNTLILSDFALADITTSSYVSDTFNANLPTYAYTLQPGETVQIDMTLTTILQAEFVEDLPAVPLPATLPTLAAGLFLLGLAARRRS